MKTLIGIFALLFSLSTNALAQNAASVGYALSRAYTSELTNVATKELIGKILGSQSYEERVSIIDSETDSALGTNIVTITIGVDDMMDDDSGWGAIYRLNIVLKRDEEGHTYNVTEIELELIAG